MTSATEAPEANFNLDRYADIFYFAKFAELHQQPVSDYFMSSDGPCNMNILNHYSKQRSCQGLIMELLRNDLYTHHGGNAGFEAEFEAMLSVQEEYAKQDFEDWVEQNNIFNSGDGSTQRTVDGQSRDSDGTNTGTPRTHDSQQTPSKDSEHSTGTDEDSEESGDDEAEWDVQRKSRRLQENMPNNNNNKQSYLGQKPATQPKGQSRKNNRSTSEDNDKDISTDRDDRSIDSSESSLALAPNNDAPGKDDENDDHGNALEDRVNSGT